jgi:hypothetical protein
LIVFIVLTVILGVTTYFFYSAREKERQVKEDALVEADRSRAELAKANTEKADYAEATGWATAAHARDAVSEKLERLYSVMNDWNIATNPALPSTAEILLSETDRAVFSMSQILDHNKTALDEALAARIRADEEKQAIEDAKNAELSARVAELEEARNENIPNNSCRFLSFPQRWFLKSFSPGTRGRGLPRGGGKRECSYRI